MPTLVDLGVVVEADSNGEQRIEAPQGLRLTLNAKGVEIANYLRHQGDPEFIFAQPVTIMCLEGTDTFVVQVGTLTMLRIGPGDNYFL